MLMHDIQGIRGFVVRDVRDARDIRCIRFLYT
jgi:hypothetical protein